MTDLTVACVLRNGGIYTPEWVEKLERQCRKNISEPFRFVCLTDMEHAEVEGIDWIDLPETWGGWWSKLCLFHPDVGLTGRTLYLDLDVLVVGDPIPQIVWWRFLMVEDFYQPGVANSSVMAWSGDYSFLWLALSQEGLPTIRRQYDWPDGTLRRGRFGGDQAFVEDTLKRFDSKVSWIPGVASYKVDCALGCVPAPDWASVIAFHGKPKPNTCGGWAQKMWEES